MKIEEGKYYRTRDGRKVGSMAYMPEGRHSEFPWVDPEGSAWKANGQFSLFDDGESVHDLIAEWTDEPADEAPKSLLGDVAYCQYMRQLRDAEKQSNKPSPFVMRRELVPGVYGIVHVLLADGSIDIEVEHDGLTAEQADEAAHLFAQLAEYLRETK